MRCNSNSYSNQLWQLAGCKKWIVSPTAKVVNSNSWLFVNCSSHSCSSQVWQLTRYRVKCYSDGCISQLSQLTWCKRFSQLRQLMSCFCGIVYRRKAFSLISRPDYRRVQSEITLVGYRVRLAQMATVVNSSSCLVVKWSAAPTAWKVSELKAKCRWNCWQNILNLFNLFYSFPSSQVKRK